MGVPVGDAKKAEWAAASIGRCRRLREYADSASVMASPRVALHHIAPKPTMVMLMQTNSQADRSKRSTMTPVAYRSDGVERPARNSPWHRERRDERLRPASHALKSDNAREARDHVTTGSL